MMLYVMGLARRVSAFPSLTPIPSILPSSSTHLHPFPSSHNPFQYYSQEFTQFGLENTVSDKLSLLGDLGGHDVDL